MLILLNYQRASNMQRKDSKRRKTNANQSNTSQNTSQESLDFLETILDFPLLEPETREIAPLPIAVSLEEAGKPLAECYFLYPYAFQDKNAIVNPALQVSDKKGKGKAIIYSIMTSKGRMDVYNYTQVLRNRLYWEADPDSEIKDPDVLREAYCDKSKYHNIKHFVKLAGEPDPILVFTYDQLKKSGISMKLASKAPLASTHSNRNDASSFMVSQAVTKDLESQDVELSAQVNLEGPAVNDLLSQFNRESTTYSPALFASPMLPISPSINLATPTLLEAEVIDLVRHLRS